MLILEDGTMALGANSYASTAFADTYHAQFSSHNDWASADDATKEEALIVATRAVDQLFGDTYMSYLRPESTQALLWPRTWFTDNRGRIIVENSIPKCLQEAVSEVAYMYFQEQEVFADVSASANVKMTKSIVGKVDDQTIYFGPVRNERFEGFRKIELILAPILKKQPGSWRLRA